MGRDLRLVSLDRVISKLYRDLGIDEISETNVIEWVSEALEFISTPTIYENAIKVIEIKNHQGDLPVGLHAIIQVARDNEFKAENPCDKLDTITKDNVEELEVYTCQDCLQELDAEVLTLPKFEDVTENLFVLNHINNKPRFTPVRLSNHTFFNSLVCEENMNIYKSCTDEYTILNDKIRTSFKEGLILLSYYRTMIDEDTGYPLIPDDVSILNAITYYVMWKHNQRMWFMGREGYSDKMQYSEQQWIKYCGQAKTNQNMLSGLDAYQNFTEEKYNWLKSFKYYNFFGNLGRKDLSLTNYKSRTNNYGR